ncbi:MAG: hypothetical protein K0S65_961 [Labilithrix sp.]|nr:hypothetical protein [Labilithrix sp.]
MHDVFDIGGRHAHALRAPPDKRVMLADESLERCPTRGVGRVRGTRIYGAAPAHDERARRPREGLFDRHRMLKNRGGPRPIMGFVVL